MKVRKLTREDQAIVARMPERFAVAYAKAHLRDVKVTADWVRRGGYVDAPRRARVFHSPESYWEVVRKYRRPVTH